MTPPKNQLTTFGFEPGFCIGDTYEVLGLLGAGWEGEVYHLKERGTNIERAGKFFFPHRNRGRQKSAIHARKLHRLRHCSVVIPYHVQEEIEFLGHRVVYQVSEYVEGLRLDQFLARQPEKHITAFQGLHLLYALAAGLEQIHALKEYHGDIHAENIIIKKFGLAFDVRLFDLHHWGKCSKKNQDEDIFDVIRALYDSLGGKATYSMQPKQIKEIICGLRRAAIKQRFPTASRLCRHLESLQW
jgi:serine/threonine protein kinase